MARLGPAVQARRGKDPTGTTGRGEAEQVWNGVAAWHGAGGGELTGPVGQAWREKDAWRGVEWQRRNGRADTGVDWWCRRDEEWRG